jgi:hypothetical protein
MQTSTALHLIFTILRKSKDLFLSSITEWDVLCKTDRSPLYIVVVKNGGSYNSTHTYAFMNCTGVMLYLIWIKTQGDSEEKLNILRDDSAGHSDKNVRMIMRLIVNGYRDRAVLFLQIRNHREW